MPAEGALPTLSRYEALFELSSEINASTDIEQVGQLLARRIKYVADVHSWRYLSLENAGADSVAGEGSAIVIDGARGAATVSHVPSDRLCSVELQLWSRRRSSFLQGEELSEAKTVLPQQFQKEDIAQVFVCPRFGAGSLQSILLFSKRRQPFNDLDVRFLTLASQIFHDKVYLLWERKKLRDLEVAYLQQEITLRQSEKLATLGRLSAGLAHELNNPASAAQRSAGRLRGEVERLGKAQQGLGAAQLTSSQGEALEELFDSLQASPHPASDLDLLSLGDLEEEIERWLEQHGLENAWELAPTLTALGFDPQRLAALATRLGEDRLAPALVSLTSRHAVSTLIGEMQEAMGRVSRIVQAVRTYSHLGQAPVQRIDLHDDLDNTVIVLGSRLGDGVVVRRDYDPDLPTIEAFGTELNQVWTNLIDNAVGAMNGKGELLLRTYREDPWAVVEIVDSGPGIPEGVQPKIFDPFFTTKPPGEGTGLGLSISHSIVVQKHGGRIDVRSRPGETRFSVRLPLELRLDSNEEGAPHDDPSGPAISIPSA